MPTDKDLIKDTLAVGGHYCNYSPSFIVGAPRTESELHSVATEGLGLRSQPSNSVSLGFRFLRNGCFLADTLIPLHSSGDCVSQSRYVVQ